MIETDVIGLQDIVRRAHQARVARLHAEDPEGWALIKWTLAHPLRFGGHGRITRYPSAAIIELDKFRCEGLTT